MSQSPRSTPFGGIDGRTLVLSAADIVQVIGQAVALKKRGRDYVGLCPFHNEKTPSFKVDPEKQYFYCFGCKAAGTVIDFVMKHQRMEFRDALHHLAERFNVDLPKTAYNKESAGIRQQLLDTASAASGYFQDNLKHKEIGQAAREYLKKRGFNDEIIEKFKIGVAIDGWEGLLRSPTMRKFQPDQLLGAGLVKARGEGDGFYDTFRNRLMFPIRDEGGRVIAFGGRVMPGSTDPAKYLNSPETPLFSKSKVAYGLDLARQRIVETKTVAIVEGYTDVVMAHQFGASNVVSVLGTALTDSHVTLLRRFADKIVLLFDGDQAGDLAVERAVQLFLTQPVEIAIATLPEGKDPDEFLLEHGLAAFDQLLATAEDALSFQWRRMQKKFSASEGDLTSQQKAVQQYLDLLANARGTGPVDSLRWGAAITRVSRLTGIPVDQINKRFRTSRATTNPLSQVVNRNMPINSFPPVKKPPNARERAERWLLGGLLLLPNAWQKIQENLTPQEFTTPELQGLATYYWDYQQHEGQPVLDELVAQISDEIQKSLVIELANEVEAMNNLHQTLSEAVQFLQQEKERLQKSKLVLDLKRTDMEHRNEDAEVLALKQLQDKARTVGSVRAK